MLMQGQFKPTKTTSEVRPERSKPGVRLAPKTPDWLAYLYTPILPILKNIKINREGPRHYSPQDILLPEGYVAEVVAGGFNAPVHCTFDDQGFCYVSEGGHKIDSKPRIIKVNVETGSCQTIYELPEERWIKTGAFTGACWHQG